MSESRPSVSRPSVEGALACDLCFARKVKCDRGNPCGGCLESKAHCLRTRRKRVRKSRPAQQSISNERIHSIIKRVSNLEDCLAGVTSLAASPKLSPYNRDVTSDAEALRTKSSLSTSSNTTLANSKTGHIFCTDEASLHRTKRQRYADKGIPNGDFFNSLAINVLESASQYPPSLEARSFILHELRHSGPSSASRRAILKSALSFVEKTLDLEFTARYKNLQGPDVGVSTARLHEKPPITLEFLYTMLNDNARTSQRAYLYEYTFCIPSTTLERMTLALLEKDGNEQTLLQYTICVHCKAFCYIVSLPLSTQSPRMQSYLRQSSQRHLETALDALDWLSLTIPPSLPLMQALLAGAILFQYQGDTDKCWTLIAHASNICKVLGWHTPTTFTFDPNNESEAEILAAVHQCYVLDKTISMNHNKPVSLPELDFLSILSSTRFVQGPFSFVIEGGLLQAQIQEKIIRHLQSDSHLGEIDRSAIIASLTQKLQLFKFKYDQVRSQPANDGDCHLHQQFMALDFAHYSLMTVLCRYDPSINKSTESREKCLSYAREALLSVRRLRDPLGRSNQASEFCSIFIMWSMLSFPLSPYFIVFCNVVATSNRHDFQLLSDIVDILAQTMDVNYSIRRLHSLCSMLMNLCKSPMNPRDEISHVPPVSTQTSFAIDGIMDTGLNSLNAVSSGTEVSSVNQSLPIFGQGLDWSCQQSVPREGEPFTREETTQMVTIPTQGGNISTCNENILRQLFEAQPNLDWLESDIPSSGIDL